MKRILRALAYGMVSIRLALAIGGAAILRPLTAFAASDLFGLMGVSNGQITATLAGTIDPVSGGKGLNKGGYPCCA